MKIYSDIALELVNEQIETHEISLKFGCKSTTMKINSKKQESLYCKRQGEYFLLDCFNACLLEPFVIKYVSEQIGIYLKDKIISLNGCKLSKIMVICLGNENILVDSLGTRVFNSLISKSSNQVSDKIFAVSPNVYSKTNIPTFDYIQALKNKIKPEICLIIDSLSTTSVVRLGSSFQICDSGINAGSAYNKKSKLICKETLGLPVISIGVPFVLKLDDFINEFLYSLSDDEEDKELFLRNFSKFQIVPKQIDVLINNCSEIITNAINFALCEI